MGDGNLGPGLIGRRESPIHLARTLDMIAELGFTIIFVIPLLAGELSRTANGGADPSHNDTAFRLRENEGTLANDCIVFRLTPVHPPPPAPPYPPGTIVDTDNNTITLRGGEDQTVWFDVMISNWGCVGTLETWQAMIGEDRLLPPGIEGIHPPCSSDSDCAAAGFGPIINQGKLGYRGAWCVDFINPNECSTVWEDENRPDWLAFDIATCDYFRRICGGTGLNMTAL